MCIRDSRKEDYNKRLDLVLTGRTLFGSAPSKGQELEEHYFGAVSYTHLDRVDS